MADINYIVNDPSTPNLIIPVNLPPKLSVPDFRINGYRGATTTMYTLEHQAACCYYTIVNAIALANKYLPAPLTKWAAVANLFIQPRAGKQLNAYYDRRALRFFFGQDPVTKNTVYTANSTDIVAHELGHAILDTLRPDLYNVQSMEIWAFHEAFGDIHAIMNLLHHEQVIDFMLLETGGDLKKSNLVTKLAEEMGTAIFNLTGGRMGHTSGMLRNAVNSYNYVLPGTLPRAGKDSQLTSEPHNFSRIFTGAWYDMFVAIYEHLKTKLPTAKDAVIEARNVLCKYTYAAIRLAPATVRFFDAMARAMLVADKANNYIYNQIMNKVFVARNILRTAVRPIVNIDWLSVQNILEPHDEVLTDQLVTAVRSKKIESLSMPYFMMNVQAPGDKFYEFDSDGNCVDMIAPSADEIIEHAHECVEFLKAKDMIRPDKLSPFELDGEGNLLRSHFSGCFGGATHGTI